MDLLRGNIKTLYFKYLSAAFGRALISSIYGIVDMAMVGRYQGPDGTAALAVVAPVWNVIYSIGLLMGIGGSVIFSTKRGSGMSADGEDDRYFTAAVIGSAILAALAIYSPIINVSTFVQCCAYSVGQASQPIISTNFGAGKEARIRETLRYALWTVVFFGVFWTAPSVACPNLYIRIFMSPTETILAMAPAIIRAYAISFLLLPFNIFSTYYFQAILQPKAAFIVSVARGLVISGALILMLPLLAGADSLWFAMPITELVTAVYAAACIRRYTARLDAKAA